MMPAESSPGRQASSSDAVSLRDCALAATAPWVPWFSLRVCNKDLTACAAFIQYDKRKTDKITEFEEAYKLSTEVKVQNNKND